MTRQEAIQEQIDEIMDTFQFDEVEKIMHHLDWKWATSAGVEGEIPDIWEIKQTARKHLKSAVKHGGSASGGFKALFHDEVDEETGKPFVLLSLNFGLDTFNDGTEYDPE